MKFAPATIGERDNGAAPFSGNCGELRHEEERACWSVRNDWTLEFDCESVRQPGLHHRRRGGRCSRLIFGRIVNATALPAQVGSAQPIAHCGVLPVEVNKRCDVAWPPGLGKRAETFPKKGSIPSHGANFNADRLTDSGLKPEIAPACHDANRRAQFAHSVGQGSTAQPGGRRQFQRSGIRDQTGVLETLPRASNTDAACFKGMGSFRLASQTGEPYTTRPAAPFPAAI